MPVEQVPVVMPVSLNEWAAIIAVGVGIALALQITYIIGRQFMDLKHADNLTDIQKRVLDTLDHALWQDERKRKDKHLSGEFPTSADVTDETPLESLFEPEYATFEDLLGEKHKGADGQ